MCFRSQFVLLETAAIRLDIGHTSLLRSGAKPIVVEKFDFSCAKCNL